MPIDLSSERGFLFRITHIANLPWLLKNGLHCANATITDPNFVAIGSPSLIASRAHRQVLISPHGTLSDYVPFYFTPKSPMLLNIKTGYNNITGRPNQDIVILVAKVETLRREEVTLLVTDRHAAIATAHFTANPADLASLIDWSILRNHDFARDPAYPDKRERYQAEALAHRCVPSRALAGIACVNDHVKPAIADSIRDAGLRPSGGR